MTPLELTSGSFYEICSLCYGWSTVKTAKGSFPNKAGVLVCFLNQNKIIFFEILLNLLR